LIWVKSLFFVLPIDEYKDNRLYFKCTHSRGADSRARWLAAGLHAGKRRAQSAQVPLLDSPL